MYKVEPPRDADMAVGVQTINWRAIRTVRHLGYLEGGIDAAVATGYESLLDDETAPSPKTAWPTVALRIQRPWG